ncbi:S9 family peptidase [Lichenicoccus sp.]|uniref:S9 family peptidase n=1 Tax=Lichenicoccus sp. TaxID=2781899 RepID=UPI003D138BD6
MSADLVAARTIALSALRADAGTLYWLENRPAEDGRGVLCARNQDGMVRVLTPAPFNVGSRVHEYGGGAYAVHGGRIGFSHRPDGSVWLIEPGAPPRPVCQVAGLRFADFCFMPDGRALLAVREDHRDAGAAQPEAAIVALSLDADGAANEGEVMVRGPAFLASPRVSADGAQLAWIAWDHPDMPWDATRLHCAPLLVDGVTRLGEARCLAGGDESLMQPLFAPDGTLHVCSDRSGWWNLYRLDADHTLQPVCPMACEIGEPPWSFGQRAYDFLPDGRIVAAVIETGRISAMLLADKAATRLPIGAVTECPVVLAGAGGAAQLGWLRAAPDAPAAVMIAPLAGGGAPAIVTVAHELPLPPEDIARAEAIRFTVADGGTGHAFYYAPTNHRYCIPDGERPPLLVMAHGGPTAMTSAALSLRIQWWTSRGIGVVDVNYGGSTGFGRAYRRRLDGQWGIVDVDDCIAACAHLVATGRADPARLAIRGSSAGGFTVLAALTRSSLFSAAACLYGIGDLTLLASETHKFEARYLDRLLGSLAEHRDIYEARSPIRNLDAVRCPVIFFHGLQDKVVPVGQTRAMAAALRARGVPVTVHEFAGEAHGFRREATIRQVLELELAFYGEQFGFTPATSTTP